MCVCARKGGGAGAALVDGTLGAWQGGGGDDDDDGGGGRSRGQRAAGRSKVVARPPLAAIYIYIYV